MLEVYNYITANTIIPSALELIEKGWVPLLKTGVVSIATTGQLVWGSDSAGRKTGVEQNSSAMKFNIENLGVLAAIIEAGGDPSSSQFTLKWAAATGTIAGGAGLFPEATVIAAVATKKIFVEEITVSMESITANAGILINMKDGTGGTDLFNMGLTIHNPILTIRPYFATTAATLLSWSGLASPGENMANDERVIAHIKYREI